MSEATIDETMDEEFEAPSEYTTETPTRPTITRDIVTAPGAATGRRKQAVARVRIVPGTGQWTINGRSLDDYFPNRPAPCVWASPAPSTASTRRATARR